MATKTVVCPECDAPLSPGRFACSSCGALLASIATVSRSFTHVESTLPPVLAPSIPDAPAPAAAVPPSSPFDEPLPPRLAKVISPRRAAPSPRNEAPASTDRVATPAPRAPRRTPRPVAPEQEPLAWVLDDSEPDAPVHVRAVAPMVAEPPPVEAPPAELPRVEPPPAVLAPAVPPPHVPVDASPPPQWPMAPSPSSEPSWPAHPTWPPPKPVGAVDLPVEPVAPRVVAGAYLPPSAVLPPGEALPIPGPARSGPGDAEGRPEREAAPSIRSRIRLGDGTGPAGLPVEVPTRIVVFGAAVAGLGFVLPWADIVIGSNAMGGYLSEWGLAGPGHVIILGVIVGLVLLALFAARLPRWVRLGLPSIAVASLLTGIIWPYLVGPFNASIGVYVVAAGAVVIIAGGLLDRIVTRHAESAATV